ncbi:hypothetical protein D3H65_15225 [Paraflavitalea soli]|uniref:Uncharacterized protein n=1 Tax=Paraflavitalea soli TaxID=2315862 RepID=A0A3B7MLA0_9BACT|nr:YdeI/OmpD-associated family protein [Paraflavitalea soli]AXY75252.1 hypothetical protein D3H65_15225 [Paraflavitalea soli]
MEKALVNKNKGEGKQKQYIDWIYSAKKEETRIERLAETINRLSRGLTLRQNNSSE